jgi:beta-lactam-binding protein with PASTA domain
MRNDLQRALSGAPVAAPMLTDNYGQGTRRMGASATQVAGRTSAIPPYRYGPDDGGPDGPPQRQHKAWPWVALIVVIAVLGASIFLIRTLNGSASGVAVPNIQGQQLAEAKQTLIGDGFKVGTVAHQHSTTVAKNLVINSQPGFGANEPKGTPIGIVVSLGSATVAVPNVVGKTKGAAESALTRAGLKVQVVTVTSNSVGPNTVVSQTPPAHSQQQPGTVVTISVTGTNVTVPTTIIGETVSQATGTLSQAPYNYTVTSQVVQGQPGTVGTVYATNPAVGSTLAPGSSIVLYVVGAASPSPPPPSSPPPSSPSTSPSTSPSP